MVQTYIPVGKIIAAHGINGGCRVHLEGIDYNSLAKIGFFFIAQNAIQFLPYHIEKIQVLNTDFILVYFEDIHNKEQIKDLVREIIYLDNPTFLQVKKKSATLHFVGYALYEKDKFLGVIETMLSNPAQPLAKIMMNGKEIFIPLHKDFILKVDDANRQIIVTLPEGLLTL